MAVDIIFPVYFEQENIEKVLKGIDDHVKTQYNALLVFQDINDPTIAVVKKVSKNNTNIHILQTKDGLGIVKAVKEGLRHVTSDYVIIMMADGSDNPKDIDKIVEKLRLGSDLVSASRYTTKGKRIGGPVIKGFLSYLSCQTLRLLTGIPTTDATNAFKGFQRAFLSSIKIESNEGYELALELTVKAFVMKKKITEVPTIWKERDTGRSKFHLFKLLPNYLRWYIYALKYK